MVIDGRPLGWVPLVVFAVVALVATAAIVWRPQLRIDPDGMTLVQWWRQVRYDFRDCSEFMTWQKPFALGNTLVVFDHRTGDGSNPWLSSRLNVRVSGVNSGLPDTFSLSADELARLLNDRRRRVVDRVEP